jgi:hypothetical protein
MRYELMPDVHAETQSRPPDTATIFLIELTQCPLLARFVTSPTAVWSGLPVVIHKKIG